MYNSGSQAFSEEDQRIDWSQFAEMTKLFINDTQPGLAPIELLRILIDEEQLPWDEAWRLVFDASKFVLNSTQKAA